MSKPKINHFRRYVELEVAELSRALTTTERRQLTASRTVLRRYGDVVWIDAKVLLLAVRRGLVTLADLDAAGVFEAQVRLAARATAVRNLYRQMSGDDYDPLDPSSRAQAEAWLTGTRQERIRPLNREVTPRPRPTTLQERKSRQEFNDFFDSLPAEGKKAVLFELFIEVGKALVKKYGASPTPAADDDDPDQAQIDATARDLLSDIEVDL